jgi:hypothetical protein
MDYLSKLETNPCLVLLSCVLVNISAILVAVGSSLTQYWESPKEGSNCLTVALKGVSKSKSSSYYVEAGEGLVFIS